MKVIVEECAEWKSWLKRIIGEDVGGIVLKILECTHGIPLEVVSFSENVITFSCGENLRIGLRFRRSLDLRSLSFMEHDELRYRILYELKQLCVEYVMFCLEEAVK